MTKQTAHSQLQALNLLHVQHKKANLLTPVAYNNLLFLIKEWTFTAPLFESGKIYILFISIYTTINKDSLPVSLTVFF